MNIPADISKVDEFAKGIVNYHGLIVYLEEGNFVEKDQSGCEHSLLGHRMGNNTRNLTSAKL